MPILKFDQTPGQAFCVGFLKGLAAPLGLFYVERVPQYAPLPQIVPPQRKVPVALSEDWRAIGRDFGAAIGRYEAGDPQEAPSGKKKAPNSGA